jgi:hypothetical protein
MLSWGNSNDAKHAKQLLLQTLEANMSNDYELLKAMRELDTEGTTVEISPLGAFAFMCCVVLAAVLVGVCAGALLWWIARLVGVKGI